MNIKKKLTLGFGFLFLIIFVLAVFCSFYIGKLSQEAGNILKDNYNSLVYSKNMISALDDMRTAISSGILNPAGNKKISDYYLKLFEEARTEFEKNLRAENANITEIHENEYVNTLNNDYGLFSNLCLQIKTGSGSPSLYFNEVHPAYEKLEHAINNITDINMQAVERKSRMTVHDSARIIGYMGIFGAFCLILASVYFWYFPFHISNSMSYLSERIKGLLNKAGLALDIRTNDEAHIILQAINLLENKLSGENKEKEPRRARGLRRRR